MVHLFNISGLMLSMPVALLAFRVDMDSKTSEASMVMQPS